ncbi:hypothetical protein [Bifidobacterium longum]
MLMKAGAGASAFSFPPRDDALVSFGSKTALKNAVHDKNHSECEFA